MIDRPEVSPILYRNQRRNYPIITHADRVYLYDRDGKRYIDAAAGAGNVAIGHGVPEIVDAMKTQAEHVCYVYGRHFTTDSHIELARKVLDWAPEGMAKVFFVSGGSEAAESAIKLARQYHVERGKLSKYKIIGRWGSYHGNTLGALSSSGRAAFQEMYGPLLLDFPHIAPFGPYRCQFCRTDGRCTLACARDLERAIRQEGPESVAGFIGEPIEGPDLGVAIPPPEYFPMIREICDRYDVLLIVDEVLTGFGRTGKPLAIDHWQVVPDMIVCGKGLSSGYVPLGAVVVHERVAAAFAHGSKVIPHGFTHGGNPLACAVGVAVLDYLEKHKLVERSAQLGSRLFEGCRKLASLASVGEVRGGMGLFVGVELVQNKDTREPYPRTQALAQTVVEVGLQNGITLIAGSGGATGLGGDCIVLAPPLVVTPDEVDTIVDLLTATIAEAQVRTTAHG